VFTLGEAMKAHMGRRYTAVILVIVTVMSTVFTSELTHKNMARKAVIIRNVKDRIISPTYLSAVTALSLTYVNIDS
jgi:hypothetical protein